MDQFEKYWELYIFADGGVPTYLGDWISMICQDKLKQK
jgi:hypothetical protein